MNFHQVPTSILILIFLLRQSVQDDEFTTCENLPTSGFLSAQQLDFICEHRSVWIKQRDSESSQKPTENQLTYLSAIEQCTRHNCVERRKRKKRETPRKHVRKEIRMLSKEEKRDLFKAMNMLKTSKIDNITAWDLHTLVHYPDSAPGAHWGPAFLPWHREFLRQFEIALQNEVPGVTLPYWDSTIDQDLPEPSDSAMWSDDLMGNGNGYVKTGPFKDWDTNVYMPLSQIPVKKLYRSTGGRPQDRLMTTKDVEWVTSRKHYKDLTFCHDKTFESIHGLGHVWVGGFMFVIRVSPNDPMFYLHHAFVDYLWEQFRRRSQNRQERETQWANDTCHKRHGYDEQMKPFRIQNRDGLSNQYTDEWYDYEPVRHCTPMEPDCDSPFYWCDKRKWRCRGKIVLGGNCTGFHNTDICMNSQCLENKCSIPPRIKTSMRKKALSENHVPISDRVWTKCLLIDEEGNGINDELSHVTIINNNRSMTVYSETETQFPEIPGTIYLPMPKPRAGITQVVHLDARDGNDRYCQSHCFNHTVERYQVCQPELTIGIRAASSSPISYTHSTASRRFLDVNLSVHPRKITVNAPYMVFACSRKLMTSAMITALAESVQVPVSTEPTVLFRVSVQTTKSNMQISVSSDVGGDWSSSLRRAQSPFDPNLVFIEAPNPAIHKAGVKLQVSLLDNGRRARCKVKCTRTDGSTFSCDGSVELHNDPEQSQENVFTADRNALQLLGWDMRGHPSKWRHHVPYLSFVC